MLFEKPVMIVRMDDFDLELIGSVHSLREPAFRILRELRRYSPDRVCVELYRPRQPTKSFELEFARQRYLDKFVCIDRLIDTTVTRYESGTPPAIYLKEAIQRYLALPLNVLSILAYSLSPQLYEKLTGGRFFTFGWAVRDAIAYIYERDEFMAAAIAGLMRAGSLPGRTAVLVGRRHVPGIKSILEAYRYTGDIGSYYAGGRMHYIFSPVELDMPYTLTYERSSHNVMMNRAIETFVRMFFLMAYVLTLFAVTAAVLLIAVAIGLALIKGTV